MLSVSSSLNTSLAHIYVIIYSAVKSARTNITCYTISNETVGINEANAKVRDVNVLRMWFPGAMNTKKYLVCPVLHLVLRSRNSPILQHAIPWLPKQSNTHYRGKLKLAFLRNASNLYCTECSDQFHVFLFSVLTIFVIATRL